MESGNSAFGPRVDPLIQCMENIARWSAAENATGRVTRQRIAERFQITMRPIVETKLFLWMRERQSEKNFPRIHSYA
jgi:hypothetical protein